MAAQKRKMAASAQAFVRGSTTRFYDWLEGSDRRPLPEGPPIWICGDCHVGNLGPLASADGAIAVEIRDLDQTVIGKSPTTSFALAFRWRWPLAAPTCPA
jgi:uncharacterized protein (DUF2252 family)